MKTIKIFLASSDELDDDRNAFGNLVRKLNKTYEKRGIKLELFEWEDYDAAYNDRRKQDEYNDNVRASDMFLAVFHTKAGKFTIEEFDVATEEFRKKGLPKSYVYCKDLKDGEVESEELKGFKLRLYHELGHYWSRYGNRDTMQLHFVMQLQLVESCNNDLKVEEGNVVLDDIPIARMENLPFACQNEDFQRMSAHIAELPKKIERTRAKLETHPDDDDYKNDLQALRNEYDKLKDDFEEYQKNLFATAKRIAQLQGERITDRIRRAMEAFNEGKVCEANIILDEAERDGEIALQEYKQSKELTEQKRQNVINSIEEIVLKTSTTMADPSIDIEERISKTERLYDQAVMMAKECDYDAEKYGRLLFDYAGFLDRFAKFNKALEYGLKALAIYEKTWGSGHTNTANPYNNIGVVYHHSGDYDNALKYYLKALAIYEKVGSTKHSTTATLYNNIGGVYESLGSYDKAIKYHLKALTIRKTVQGTEHPSTADSYNNIGLVYHHSGDYNKALENFFKAKTIRKKVFEIGHPNIANSYNNIGTVYHCLGDHDKALEYYLKALAIYEKTWESGHTDTANSYNNIGVVYHSLDDYNKAIEYYLKALVIYEKVWGSEHPRTATLLDNIGANYGKLSDYDKAIEYYLKALVIYEKVWGSEHPHTATLLNNIGTNYGELGNYDKAIEYCLKALVIYEKVLGPEHPHTATLLNNIGAAYHSLGNYDKALEYYFKVLTIHKKTLGPKHPSTISTKKNIDFILIKGMMG